MAESIATGLAVDATKAVTKVVTARALDDIRLDESNWTTFKEKLEKLKNRLLYIQEFMDDLGSANPRLEKNKLVNFWLQKLKDVAYSADEIMDDYAYEIMRRKHNEKLKYRSFFTPSTNPVVFRVKTSHRVSEIHSKLDELEKEAKKIGLKHVQLRREEMSSTLRLNDNEAVFHAGGSNEFIGRKVDEEKLLQMIVNPKCNEGQLTTIAILGIGGIGKTTLARRLYEHEDVDKHFGKRKVMLNVSQHFNARRILKQMLESLTLTKCDFINSCTIVTKLQQELNTKKFFLVLDDVCTTESEMWDSLKKELLRIGDAEGSVILITTQTIEVVEKAHAFSHKLEGLSEEDGLALLKESIFEEMHITPYVSFFDQDIGRRIVDKCKGVPLAIKAIRGVLQSKESQSDWEMIVTSELWDLRQDDANCIMPSLLLSYNNLPSVYVKQCFAYCTIFPKDRLLEKDELIALWLAQGFLHDVFEMRRQVTSSMEVVGEKYFNILVNFSLLQEYDKKRYKMHDLVHDLAAYILQNDLVEWKGEVGEAFHVRHLVFDLEENRIAPVTPVSQTLRTISFWGGMPRWDSLICAQYLRTLIMVDVGLQEVPSVIGKLVHLRYLDLSHNWVTTLPESICKLFQLLTLRLLNSYLLRELPKDLHKLVKLRHIQTTTSLGTWLLASKGLCELTSLETLPPLELRGGEGWTIDELAVLNQVKGEICISGLEHVKSEEEARKACLGRKDKILKLNLEWGLVREENSDANNDVDVLDGLEPHPNIASLVVSRFNGVSFPYWVMTMTVKQGGDDNPTLLTNLTEVELKNCNKCQQLPTLGQLPSLRILKLSFFRDVECISNEFYGGSNNAEDKVIFRCLKELHIGNFQRLTTWLPPALELAAAVFPFLESLTIFSCKELEMVPASIFQSLRHLTLASISSAQPLEIIKYSHGLKSLTVEDIKNLMYIPQELSNCNILEELQIASCPNLMSIPIKLISLKNLVVSNCSSLVFIPDDTFQGLTSLHELRIENCDLLKKIPTSLTECSSLEFLCIENCPLVEGPFTVQELGKLLHLKKLVLINAGELMTTTSPQWILHLPSLRELEIGGFTDEEEFMTFLSGFTPTLTLSSNQSPLRRLILRDCPSVKSLCQELLQFLPNNIKYLKIQRFEELEELPDQWIRHLSGLEILELNDCKKLKFLPSKEVMQSLTQLQHLHILMCPLLKERYAKDHAPERIKITCCFEYLDSE